MIEALAAGMRLLEMIAESETVTLSEAARCLAMTPNRTFRLIQTFLELGYIESAGNKTYRLGPKVLLLGHRAAMSTPLTRIATHHLEALAKETGEAVFLGVRHHLQQITAASWPPAYGWPSAPPTQPQLPLHTGSMGICLLSYAPADILVAVLAAPRKRFTSNTLTEENDIVNAIDGVRRDGYRVSEDEFSSGWLSIAAPILDRSGMAAAAIAIGFGAQRLSDPEVHTYAAELRKTAGIIARALP